MTTTTMMMIPTRMKISLFNIGLQVLLLLLTLTLLSSRVSGVCTGPRTPGELRDALWINPDSGYDKYTRPSVAARLINQTVAGFTLVNPWEAPPETARIQLHVLSLVDVDQKRSEYQMVVWFRKRWNDYRLKHEGGSCFLNTSRVGYDESILREIWSPDIFVENQIRVSQNVAGSVWIYTNGDVVHVSQLLITLACNMDFQDFPHDQQSCVVRVGTFMEDASQVVLDFWEDIPEITVADKSADGAPIGGTQEWVIINASAVKQDNGKLHGAINAESSVELQLVLERESDYYFSFVLVPSAMFVTIGWSSFFINRAVAPARVAMSIIGFLANMNFLAAQLGQLPKLGNDVWLLQFLFVSSIFSFYAVMEYVVCNHLHRIEARIEGGKKRAREMIYKKHQKDRAFDESLRKRSILKNRNKKKNGGENEGQNDDDNDIEGGGQVSPPPSGVSALRSRRVPRPESAPPDVVETPPTTSALDNMSSDDEMIAVDQYDIDIDDIQVTKADMIQAGFNYKLDKWIMNSKGEMYFRDQTVDIFSRYAYPIAYILSFCFLWFYRK